MTRRRKAHTKSREGCTQCKVRHAKCDEVRPQCLQCERANIPCSFSSSAPAPTPLNEDSVANLELLEQWYRYPVTGDLSETMKQLQSGLVRVGFSHFYLLDAILALTALQLYSKDRSQYKWYTRAVTHQQAAIARARPHFQSLNQIQRQALLGFSAFTSMYAIAEPILRPARIRSSSQVQFDPVGEVLQGIQLSRSTAAFVRQNFPPLVISESWPLSKFGLEHHGLLDAHGLEMRFPQMTDLQACINDRCDAKQRATYLHAVELLFHRIAFLTDNPNEPETAKVIWHWGLEVSQPFLDLCSARQPIALVILAYFTALMSFYKDHWCLRDWPGRLLRHIRGVLGDAWEEFMKWPNDLVFGSPTLTSKVMAHTRGYC